MIKKINQILPLLLGTIFVLVPSFVLRVNLAWSMTFYHKFGTYLSDLWNFFANYLQKGLEYLPEYPVGLRFIYETFHFNQITSHGQFILINCLIITLCAVIITYLLYLIVKKNNLKIANIWYFWILAPSFIFYSLYNYDLLAIVFMVLAYYLFDKKKYSFSAISLAVGTVIKFFPIYLAPLFILNAPKGKRLKYFLIFLAVILLANLPYLISNFQTWIYPYVWQISENVSSSAHQQTFWWILYPIFGKSVGLISLLVFAGLYACIYFKLRQKPIIYQIIAVVILFLITDRIYSPQYNLFLLPFLVLAPYCVNKKIFYPMEIINVAIVFFFFKLTNNLVLLQILVFIRLGLLIWLFANNYKASKSVQIAK